jgi:hypothetical protein
MNYLFRICLFLVLLVWVGLLPTSTIAQDTKKERRELARNIKRGRVQVSKDLDTIFIEREKLVEVPKEVVRTVKQVETVYKDTCEKSRFELRHERKQAKQEDNTSIKLAKIEAERQVSVLKLENQGLRDSLKLLKELEKTRGKVEAQNLKQEVKLEKQKNKPKWKWYHVVVFSIGGLIILLVVIFIISKLL